MRQRTGEGSRGRDDRGPSQVRVYVTRNGGRYVKGKELMESAAAQEAIAAMRDMEKRDRESKAN